MYILNSFKLLCVSGVHTASFFLHITGFLIGVAWIIMAGIGICTRVLERACAMAVLVWLAAHTSQ